LVLPDSTNPFFAEVGRAIDNAAYQRGYSLLLCNTDGSSEKETSYLELLAKKRVDGIIYATVAPTDETLHSLVQDFQHVVVIDNQFLEFDIRSILADNLSGGYIATRHLINLGHTRIACIAGPSELSSCQGRVDGYLKALEEAGIKTNQHFIHRGDWHPESGRYVTHKLLESPNPPSAIFACNDLMAIGAIYAAHEKELVVPQDIAVIGFDDIELASYMTPGLTTISQPKHEIGEAALDMIIDGIQGKESISQSITLPVNLVIRKSCGGQPSGKYSPAEVIIERPESS
jgi:LacI family transcriptional regulator